MGIMADVRVNTTQRMIIYRDFVIQENDNGWEWSHGEDALWTSCNTIFECIEAIAVAFFIVQAAREHELTLPKEHKIYTAFEDGLWKAWTDQTDPDQGGWGKTEQDAIDDHVSIYGGEREFA
jgi:hypothetical protein